MWVRNKEQWADRRAMPLTPACAGCVVCLDPSSIRSLVISGSDSAAQDASLRRGVRPHPHASEPVVSLITWRPQAWERRLSLRVDSRSQRSRFFYAGTSVARDNRLATSVQTHFFRYRQCGSCRQARALDAATLRLARQGGGGRWKTLRAKDAREERARRAGEGAASQVVRSSALGRRPTRGGESARTRWSCGGSARPPNFQARRSHGRAHWQK